jgi:hypothetical protein
LEHWSGAVSSASGSLAAEAESGVDSSGRKRAIGDINNTTSGAKRLADGKRRSSASSRRHRFTFQTRIDP